MRFICCYCGCVVNTCLNWTPVIFSLIKKKMVSFFHIKYSKKVEIWRAAKCEGRIFHTQFNLSLIMCCKLREMKMKFVGFCWMPKSPSVFQRHWNMHCNQKAEKSLQMLRDRLLFKEKILRKLVFEANSDILCADLSAENIGEKRTKI